MSVCSCWNNIFQSSCNKKTHLDLIKYYWISFCLSVQRKQSLLWSFEFDAELQSCTMDYFERRLFSQVGAGAKNVLWFICVQAGKSLYRRKVHYRLFSCQSTLSLAVGKDENKSHIFQNNLSKSWLTTVQAVVHLPV